MHTPTHSIHLGAPCHTKSHLTSTQSLSHTRRQTPATPPARACTHILTSHQSALSRHPSRLATSESRSGPAPSQDSCHQPRGLLPLHLATWVRVQGLSLLQCDCHQRCESVSVCVGGGQCVLRAHDRVCGSPPGWERKHRDPLISSICEIQNECEGGEFHVTNTCVCVCACMCVCGRKKEGGREGEREGGHEQGLCKQV